MGMHEYIIRRLRRDFPEGATASEIEKGSPYALSTIRAELSYMKKLGLVEEVPRIGKEMKVKAIV